MTRRSISSWRWTAGLAGITVLSAIALAPTAVRADAGGIGFWLPGGMGSLAAVPGQPGWSLTTIYLHVGANAGAGKELQQNASIVTGLHARADAIGVLPAYTLQRRCWAGN